ncbi:MAG: YceI family protein [Bacteroidia bacterium]
MSTLRFLLTFTAFGSILLMSFAPVLENKTFTVDAENSTLTWVGQKVTGKHTGEISLKSGNFIFEEGTMTSGEFTIDMSTITVTDLEGEWAAKLLGHLKSDDFFGVESFKTSTFKTTKIEAGNTADNYTITGDLTLKGITKPVTFPVTVTTAKGKVTTTGTATIDRTKYGIRYGSGSFFDDLGDKAISDNFELTFNIVSK